MICPDELDLNLHIDKNDLTRRIFKISLYKEGKRKWLEYIEADKNIDIVAIPVDLPDTYYVTAFREEDFITEGNRNFESIYVPIGDDLLVVGYPDGLYDREHNMPIFRNASLASVYPLQHQKDYYFLIDSLLHDGSSGSPVLLKKNSTIVREFIGGGRQYGYMYPDKRCLIGIHSGDFDLK